MAVEIGLEKPQIEGSIRKHTDYQICNEKKCNPGKIKTPITNQMLLVLNVYYSLGNLLEIHKLPLVPTEFTSHST